MNEVTISGEMISTIMQGLKHLKTVTNVNVKLCHMVSLQPRRNPQICFMQSAVRLQQLKKTIIKKTN